MICPTCQATMLTSRTRGYWFCPRGHGGLVPFSGSPEWREKLWKADLPRARRSGLWWAIDREPGDWVLVTGKTATCDTVLAEGERAAVVMSMSEKTVRVFRRVQP